MVDVLRTGSGSEAEGSMYFVHTVRFGTFTEVPILFILPT